MLTRDNLRGLAVAVFSKETGPPPPLIPLQEKNPDAMRQISDRARQLKNHRTGLG
jgi:hypothetical protein